MHMKQKQGFKSILLKIAGQSEVRVMDGVLKLFQNLAPWTNKDSDNFKSRLSA